jgi:hypothetical protein
MSNTAVLGGATAQLGGLILGDARGATAWIVGSSSGVVLAPQAMHQDSAVALAASSGILLAPVAGTFKGAYVTAASGVRLGPAAGQVRWIFPHAANTVVFNVWDNGNPVHTFTVAAANHLYYWAADDAYNSKIYLSAEPASSGLPPDLTFAVLCDAYVFPHGRPASATTRLSLGATCVPAPRFWRPAAASRLALAGSWCVANPTRVDRDGSASGLGVHATASAWVARAYPLAAANAIKLGPAAGQVRAGLAAAASRVALGPAATASRAASVAAASAIVLSPAAKSNQMLRPAAASRLALAARALPGRGARGAASGALAFIDRADGVVVLPWRRAPALLPPGGGLPH